MSGRFAAPEPKEESTFEQIKKAPIFAVAVNATLFGLGVLFIQSPLMDMLMVDSFEMVKWDELN
ncbi:hypothetical protein DFJ63DRAFT_341939 [Scheffersomyces coipomensis]|uniref:uncharacterized protein n=1 Tax=Scheffersomyces coipomensis TaxID=1788519 RepID=UPI00315C99BB